MMPEVEERTRVEVERELADAVTRLRDLGAVLLHEYSREEVSRMLDSALARVPESSPLEGVDSKRYAREYQRAVEELRRERQEFLGVEDVVRGLLMFVESPAERVRKNLHLERGD
jgi:hypothetical protein